MKTADEKMTQSLADTPTRCSRTSTPSLKALQEGWSPWKAGAKGSFNRPAVDLEEDGFASTINSIGIVFEAERDPFTKLVHVPTYNMEGSTSSEERTRAFTMLPSEGEVGQDQMDWKQPRAGGVRTPARTSSRKCYGSEASDSRRCSVLDSSQLHRRESVRMWNHEGELIPVDDVAERGETYLQSRQRSSFVAHHRTSSSLSSRSVGALSPQMWRGEAIEESHMPSPTTGYSVPPSHTSRVACDGAQVCYSGLSSRRSSALPNTGCKVSGVHGNSKLAGDFVNSHTHGSELHLPMAGGMSCSGGNCFASTHEGCDGSGVTTAELLGRIDCLEHRLQCTEETLRQTVEKFETIQASMKELISVMQSHPSSLTLRLEPSIPSGDSKTATREPSRAMDN